MDRISPLNLIAKLAGVSKMTVSRASTSVGPGIKVPDFWRDVTYTQAVDTGSQQTPYVPVYTI